MSVEIRGKTLYHDEQRDDAPLTSDRVRLGTTREATLVATVRVAIPLSAEEISALQRALERYAAQPVTLEIEMDPEIIGGVWVRLGDVVIDGSVKARLESLRQHLCAQCRVILSTGIPAIETEFRV